MQFLKDNYKKILIVVFILIFFSMCSKNCSKSNDLRKYDIELDSCIKINKIMNDSILSLNTIIEHKNIEIESKNTQIEQLSTTLSTLINKNQVNHIRVVIPENKKDIN